jgi:DNA-binding CsgD family transcriptional regulator
MMQPIKKVDLRRDFENTCQAHKTVHSRWSRGYYRTQVRTAQPPVRDSRGPIVGAVGKVQTFLTPAQVEALVTSYRAGTSTTELSETFGIHRRTVVVHLHRQGVPLRRDGLPTKDTKTAARLYNEGWSLAQIATRFGTTANTVRAALRRNGVEMRKPWERTKRPG